jgi:hypothetical protein
MVVAISAAGTFAATGFAGWMVVFGNAGDARLSQVAAQDGAANKTKTAQTTAL